MDGPTWTIQFVRPIFIYVIVVGLVGLGQVSQSAIHSADSQPTTQAESNENCAPTAPIPTQSLENNSTTTAPAVEATNTAEPADVASTSGSAPDQSQQTPTTASPPTPEERVVNFDQSHTNNLPFDAPQISGNASPAPAPDRFASRPAITSATPWVSDTDLIDKAILAQVNNEQTTTDETLARLNDLPKPAAGNNHEANRLNVLGLQELKNKDYPQAVRLFKTATEWDAADPKFLSNLGFAEMNNQDFTSAMSHLRSSISLAPARSVAWGDLGLLLAKKGEQERAVACFLIGYKVSKGRTITFIKSLQDDDDSAIRRAGEIALAKIQSLPSQ